MSRHLTPLNLAQLVPAEPPPAGHIALYPGTDGTLRQQDSAGQESRLPAATRAALGADFLHTNLGYWETIPGLAVPVQPGLHRFAGQVNITTERLVWHDLRLRGPAPAAISMDTYTISFDSGFHSQKFTYDWGSALYGQLEGPATSLAFQGAVLVQAPGVIKLDAALVYFSQPLDFDDWTGYWSTSGADIDGENTDFVHSGTYAGKITAQDAGRAVVYDWEDTSPGTRWRLGAWLYSPTGHPRAGVAMSWYGSDGQIGDARHEGPLPAGVWTYYEVEADAPEGTVEMYVQAGMEVSEGHGAGSVVYIDDVVWRTMNGSLSVLAGSYLQVTPF